MKASELREKSRDELKSEILGLRKEMMNLRFQQANLTMENTARVQQVRREIARCKTILTEIGA